MKYFYATFDYDVHEVFDRRKTAVYRLYREKFDLPWSDILARLNYLYTSDDMNKSLREKGIFMTGRVRKSGVMIIDLEFDGNFRRSTGKELYEAVMKKLKPILRERKIDSIL